MNEKALQKPGTTVASYLNSDSVKKYLENMLDKRTGPFITSLVSLANLTPNLAACDPKTLMFCGLKAASLNLPLDNNLQFAFAIPYGNQAQFQMGYRGFVQLAQRTGQYKSINVIDIRQGELVGWDVFTEALELELIPDQDKREKQPVIGYAAMFELLNGYTKRTFWTRERVEKHGKRFSKTYNNGPWKTDFDAMAKKTVLKDLLSKWGPLSTEMQEALKYDQAVIKDESGEPEYLDAEFEVTEEIVRPASDLEEEFQQGQMSMDGGASEQN